MPRWPRPLPIDPKVIDLPVEDGNVQLQPLHDRAQDVADILAVRTWKLLKGAVQRGESTQLPFTTIAEELVRSEKDTKWAHCLLAQFCFKFGQMLEKALLRITKGEVECPTSSFRWVTWEDCETQYQLDHQLLRYVLSCRVTLGKPSHLHITTDAHTGCGLKLHNSLISKGNVVALAPPQAYP